jgi:ElaB/YqjD/DUF883 family membrane-anchored ribosome-binding protein
MEAPAAYTLSGPRTTAVKQVAAHSNDSSITPEKQARHLAPVESTNMNTIQTDVSNGYAGDGGGIRRTGPGALRRELDAVISDSEELLQRVGHLADADIAKVRDKVAASIERARRAAGSSLHALKDRGQRAAATADEYVHERPWTTVAIAAAVGLTLGALLRRR